MRSLTEIMDTNGSDKGGVIGEAHKYTKIYERDFGHIRYDNISLFEIGICDPRKHGASIVSWYEYFPNAKIYGYDLVDAKQFDNDRIKTFIGNQAVRSDLANACGTIGKTIDIIIDDGSHIPIHQLTSLGFLFKHLTPGWKYYIEDIHVSQQTVEFLHNLEKPACMSQDEYDYFINNYESIFVSDDNKLGIIKKKADVTKIFEKVVKIETRDDVSVLGHMQNICELGVQTGDYMVKLCDSMTPQTYVGVDMWRDGMAIDGREFNYKVALKKSITLPNAKFFVLPTTEAAELFPDCFFDFVYIDADHRYEGISKDILSWTPKVKYGGVLAGHDYKNLVINNGKYVFGVIRAVSEFCAKLKNPLLHITKEDIPSWFLVKNF